VNEVQTYEHFPAWIVVLCNLVSWSIYAIGAYILARLWIWLLVPYLLYVLWLEIRLLRKGCVDCAYYGKACAFGKGKLCAVAFERGDPQRFAEREISWAEVLPDFLVSILPLIGGVVFLVANGWDWSIAALLALLVILASGGTAFVRGTFACRYCKQRELGCPAYELFGGTSDD
jgi:hypothetical protein